METDQIFASAELSPDRAVAGESTEFVIRLVVGPAYTRSSSRIIFDFPAMLGMSRPSLNHAEDDGFIDVRISNPTVTYQVGVWDIEAGGFVGQTPSSHRGMAQRLLVLDLSAGLVVGDTIEAQWGDTRGGLGVGARVTTVVPIPEYTAVLHIRYFEDQTKGLPDLGRSLAGNPRPTPDCELALGLTVRPRELHHLRLFRQMHGAALVPYDVFWNVAQVQDAQTIVAAQPAPVRNALGVFEFADKNVQVRSRSKPLIATPRMDNALDGLNIYWGDVHTHSAFSRDCVEREKLQMLPGDLMRYGRDCARLDFCAVTDHHNPHRSERRKIGAPNWQRTMEMLAEYDEPGRFLVFPGFEYGCARGDTVVLCNWLPDYDEIDCPEWTDIRRLWQAWHARDYFTIPHFHNPGALPQDTWWSPLDPVREPVIEVFSCHGSFERMDVLENQPPLCKARRPDRQGDSFLRASLHYGFVCNSDDHKGHIGVNGLTAVLAPTLDKASLVDAYRRRRVYGTTNARIRLIWTANGELMGSILPNTSEKRFSIDVCGESPLKRIDLFRNGDPYQRFIPEGIEFRQELTVRDDEPSNWYVRVTQMDNHQAFSSPIWFE